MSSIAFSALVLMVVLQRFFFIPETTSDNHNPYRYRDQMDAPKIVDWHQVPLLKGEIAQFETVFWEPDDTNSLREWLVAYQDLPGSRVFEIGTGTGLIALCCGQYGAEQIVAADINPNACANADYNSQHFDLSEKIDVRLVSKASGNPFELLTEDEQFDLIISNPPWEDAPVEEVAAYALYDPSFQLMDRILDESATFLKPDGKLLLAYGATQAIRRLCERAPATGWNYQVLDDRSLDDLPDVFVPGILILLERTTEAD